ncbi:chemotaxis protein CheD [bacterium]|nr:chemotaxis protein CheD [bacterium]
MNHIVGIADMKLSSSKDDVLVTYSLGSCVGLSVYDPVACVGGIIHCMLPLSKIDPAKAEQNPLMFTDTGAMTFLQEIFNMGGERGRLVAKVAGCSSVLDDKGLFKIGERNYTVLKKILWKNNILIAAEDVGGNASRTMSLHMDSGRTTIRSGGTETEL